MRLKLEGDQAADDARHFARRREAMVRYQLRQRGISNQQVLQSMRTVPRHLFVPAELVDAAYEDRPLPIGFEQTISQPYIVGLMTELVQPQPQHRALEIGTGSGYQAAVLAELVDQVYGIEIVPALADQAAQRLVQLGYDNVTVRYADGYRGWPEQAPFDIIIVAAAPTEIPQPLLDQLAPGGKMVIPIGGASQDLRLVERLADGELRERQVAGVRFVPMTGEAQRRD
ncbi:MAG: protein-L-isoaspartate(D-aspartate) O-methyltransferase [Pirellulaceae bacterium]|nr:protein-L-isoaspartate(D-aspartate) O-methyltransferase [Pirellulaceae bacterium]